MRPPSSPSAVTVPYIIGSCPVCEWSPVDHPLWLLASAISSRTPNRVEELETLISEGRWAEAAAIQEWLGTEDEVQYVAIKCPVKDGAIGLKKMYSLFDMWSDDQCLANMLIDESGQKEIDALAAGEWHVVSERVG
jgi:hypothetical protein